MAELLVRAKAHWMDDLTQKDVDKMSVEEKQSYEARSQIGDIICVYPDGACKEDPAPDSCYVIVKIPDLDYKEAKEKYEQPLLGEPNKDGYRVMLRHRMYALPETDIKTVALTTSKTNTLSKSIMDSKVITKTVTAEIK